MPRAKDIEATLDMLDGWPQVLSELRDEEGAQIRGMSVGKVQNVARKGATIKRGNGQETVFPSPVQPQIVVMLEKGVLLTEGYDLTIHREAMDIPEMQTTPAELQEQLFADGGDQMVTGGQRLRNQRKEGVSHKKWHAGYQPSIRNRG